MFLSGVLFAIFLAGCWIYCLTEAATTPAAQFRGLPKRSWMAVIAGVPVLGGVAWLVSRGAGRARARPRRARAAARPGAAAGPGLDRHPAGRLVRPAGRTVPIGPDDDPEFLRLLGQRISGSPDAGD
jgi:Phospholipase_D-nuclease N-terminal